MAAIRRIVQRAFLALLVLSLLLSQWYYAVCPKNTSVTTQVFVGSSGGSNVEVAQHNDETGHAHQSNADSAEVSPYSPFCLDTFRLVIRNSVFFFPRPSSSHACVHLGTIAHWTHDTVTITPVQDRHSSTPTATDPRPARRPLRRTATSPKCIRRGATRQPLGGSPLGQRDLRSTASFLGPSRMCGRARRG